MFVLKNITKSFGEHVVLDRISLSLGPREVVGLIGPNGSGKTTLLRLIHGEIVPEEGSITRGSKTIALLPQHFDFDNLSVGDYLRSQLRDPYATWRIETVMERVGLSDLALNRQADTLSGGQKTRLGLAALLLPDPVPTVLLLDEPTNNLDVAGLSWLENFVLQFNGNILFTSHDRAFLDRTVGRIIELDNGRARLYGGNYSFYRQQKLLEAETIQQQYQENLAERRRLEYAVTVQRQKSQHAHCHMKPLPDNDKFARTFFRNRVTRKYGQQAKALEARLNQLEAVEKPTERKRYAIDLFGSSHAGKLITQLDNVSKSYCGNAVLSNISLTIRSGDRLHVSGPNGSGKSTLLSIATGRLQPDSGAVILGSNVRIGYFSQESSELDSVKTGLSVLLATGASAERCYRHAMSLHLSDADLKKPVGELSRGMVAKLAFARLLLQENHLLILDEPMNHLEINAREDIEAALLDYHGALLLASHDSYFIQQLGITSELNLDKNQMNGDAGGML